MNEDTSEPVSHGGCAPDAGFHCIWATLCGVHASLALKGAHLQCRICIIRQCLHAQLNKQPVFMKTMTAALPVTHTPLLMAGETETRDREPTFLPIWLLWQLLILQRPL